MQRPGLAQLMTDIKARRVDVIVVYKALDWPARRQQLGFGG